MGSVHMHELDTARSNTKHHRRKHACWSLCISFQSQDLSFTLTFKCEDLPQFCCPTQCPSFRYVVKLLTCSNDSTAAQAAEDKLVFKMGQNTIMLKKEFHQSMQGIYQIVEQLSKRLEEHQQDVVDLTETRDEFSEEAMREIEALKR